MDPNSTNVQEIIRSQLDAMSMLSRKLIARKIVEENAFAELEFIDLQETPFQKNISQQDKEVYQLKESLGVGNY